MEKLAMCRMCLANDVPMRLMENKYLQAMFEKMTEIPFVREDRPILACYICCARMHNCYKFRNNCLQSEELLQQMLNNNELTPVKLKQLLNTKMLSITKVVNMSCSGVVSDNTEVHVEGHASVICHIEVKEEITEGENNESSEEQYVEYADTSQWLNAEVDPLNEYKYDIPLKTERKVLQTCDDVINEDQAPERFTQSKPHEDSTCHEKKELVVEKAVNRSRCKTQPKEICASPGDTKYECDLCNKHFNSKIRLITHIRSHTANKRYKCNICNKAFIQKNKLLAHNRTHTGDKPYTCNTCNKSFSQKGNLDTHHRTHTGDKPFKCTICSKCYTEKGSLVKHIDRKHTDDKPHKCNVCSKCFTRMGDLVTHKRKHICYKPYRCNICNKCFTQNYNLVRHHRIHTGEKPYICNICLKSFRRKSHLFRHNLTHTGDKPFTCNVCSKAFNQKGNLDTHIRIHAGVE